MPYRDKDKKKAYDAAYYQRREKKVKEQWKINKQQLHELRSTLSCCRCGFSHPAALDFHHRDPNQKKFEIPRAFIKGFKSREEIMEEIAKCDILCANCHRIEHYSL